MQLGIPALSRRTTVITLLVSGSLLMGVPSFAYIGDPATPVVLIASALRGAGFGLVSIVATAVVIQLASVQARSRAIGRFGLLTGMIAALSPALGVRLFDAGYGTALFCVSGALPLLGLAVFPYRYLHSLHGSLRAPRVLPLLRSGTLARPTIVFALAAVGYGAVVSYLPTSFAGAAALMLLVFGVVQALLRGVAGRAPAAVIQGAGLRTAACAALVGALTLWGASAKHSVALAYTGLVWFGLGLGALTTASLAALAIRGSDRTQLGPAVLWNIAFDAGIALGGLIFSVVAHSDHVSSIYAVCAVLLVLAVGVAISDGRHESPTAHSHTEF
jgi:predicted MFS family arabinose efflux permease